MPGVGGTDGHLPKASACYMGLLSCKHDDCNRRQEVIEIEAGQNVCLPPEKTFAK